jgi:hypothetical protein
MDDLSLNILYIKDTNNYLVGKKMASVIKNKGIPLNAVFVKICLIIL